MKKLLKNNIKTVMWFVIGLIISGTTVYAATSFTASNVTYTSNGQSTVQGAVDDLYRKVNARIVLISPVKLGDYISLTPTKNTYTIKTSLTGSSSDQTINPSELNLWRVIDIHSDGSFDAVSEYTSSTNVNFRGAKGYQNLVGALNTIAAQYQVPNYTIGSRMMGYGGQSEIISNSYNLNDGWTKCADENGTCSFSGQKIIKYGANSSWYYKVATDSISCTNSEFGDPISGTVKECYYTSSAPSTSSTNSGTNPTTGVGQEWGEGVLGDTLYLKDYILVGNVYKSDTSTYESTGLKAYDVSATTTARYYWLASRMYSYDRSTRFGFSGRNVSWSGIMSSNELSYYKDGYGWLANSLDYRVRPILTLKSGLTVKSGSGTKASPYVFN